MSSTRLLSKLGRAVAAKLPDLGFACLTSGVGAGIIFKQAQKLSQAQIEHKIFKNSKSAAGAGMYHFLKERQQPIQTDGNEVAPTAPTVSFT